MPRQFTNQLALFTTLILVLSIGGHTLYNTYEMRQWKESQLVLETDRLLESLAATTAAQILIRDYSSLERTLLQSANQPDVLAIRVIDRSHKAITQVLHQPGQPPEAVFDFATFTPLLLVPPHENGWMKRANRWTLSTAARRVWWNGNPWPNWAIPVTSR